jgi:hypothetical protein
MYTNWTRRLQVPTAAFLKHLVRGCSLHSPLLLRGMLQLACRLHYTVLEEPVMQLAVQLMKRLEEAAEAGRFLGPSPDACSSGALVGQLADHVLTAHGSSRLNQRRPLN